MNAGTGGGQRLRRGLEEAGCGALLLLAESARDPDVAHHVGAIHVGACLLVLPAEGPPRLGYFSPMEREEAAGALRRTPSLELLSPDDLEIVRARREGWDEARTLAGATAAALAAVGLTPGRVAVAGHGAAGRLLAAAEHLKADGWELVDGSGLARELRKSKSADHVAGIRRAARGACRAFRAVAATLAEAAVGEGGELRHGDAALSVGGLRAVIARTLAEDGLEQPHGNIVAPGRDAGIPHSAGEDSRVLRAGEALVVDLYPSAPPFADCTRTFCVGEAPAALAEAHAAVLHTLCLAHDQAVPGARAWDLQMAACAVLEERGYANVASDPETTVGYVHGLGHGVGYELHEYPTFRKEAGSEGVLAEGDVVTLEPGLYDPEAEGGGWGVRLEDLVWLGPQGAENLTPLPYDLDPRAWD